MNSKEILTDKELEYMAKTVKELSKILYMIIKEHDIDIIAKQLIDSFGGFAGVLDAPLDELTAIEGVDDSAAKYIKSIKDTALFYIEDKNSSIKRVYDTDSAYEVLKSKFIGRKREAVALLLLDGRSRIVYNGIVNEGSVSEVPIYIRRIVELCLKFDAYTAIISHNHPSGNPIPSRNDLNATRDVEFALNGIDVDLIDHIIFAGTDYTSLKSSEWMEKIKKEVKEYKKTLKAETRDEESALLMKLRAQLKTKKKTKSES